MVKCTKREVRKLRTALRWKLAALQRQRIQMVLLRESGMTQPAIAEAMGVSLSTVNRAHMAYDQGGLEALRPKPCGGRKRENMTIAQEKALLARFAKAAGAGEMLNIHDLKRAYEQAIGHGTSTRSRKRRRRRALHVQSNRAAVGGTFPLGAELMDISRGSFSLPLPEYRLSCARLGRV